MTNDKLTELNQLKEFKDLCDELVKVIEAASPGMESFEDVDLCIRLSAYNERDQHVEQYDCEITDPDLKNWILQDIVRAQAESTKAFEEA